MKKAPRELPKVGDRVKLMGRKPSGVLYRIEYEWAWVAWDSADPGPKIVHIRELLRSD